MAMAESEQHKPEPTPAQVRRGRRIALLLFAIGFGPMIVATVMFYTGWMNPTGQSNNGTLVRPPVAVADLGLVNGDGEPLADRFGPQKADATWMMLVVAGGECAAECQEQVYLARQVNTALGKNQDRMQRAAYLEQAPDDLSGYPDMPLMQSGNGESPRWPGNVDIERTPQIYVIDPFGNIMMRYGPGHTGKAMLEDLKHLMKISHIG
ncbi:hypothetical protein J057_07981 [Marinobacter nanhaiticus D15-8W]|uniref:Cytochrome C oxidase subunit I n=2 Tax=Marinobacter TaxID=2742 RepID=N6X2I9_9GAMM|nr:hypothetical protein J057_07981 [Marinobacter nanhaiticus D15-8W]